MDPLIDPHAPAAILARMALAQQLQRLRDHRDGTRAGDHDETLHDMRVATRRLRAALRLFRHHLPTRRARHLREELRWLASALGSVRDLDVQLAWLRECATQVPPHRRPGFARLTSELEAERARARRRLERVLDSQRYARLAAGLAELTQRRARVADCAPAATIARTARALLDRQFKRVADLVATTTPRSASAEQLHALRIRCKRLRYALEFHALAFGEPALELLPALVALQDILGAHQDAVVAQRHLLALHPQGVAIDPAVGSALGAALANARRRARHARTALPGLLRGVRLGAWRRARRAFPHAR